ncbi:hypothetical protein SDC9_186199 [bioreactor metagenome]|uniref:Uncharacterized protein n=1 Tax=bioreactor metagenome TaxID=1076179 RepID=A0A645HR93_9ZZZZ
MSVRENIFIHLWLDIYLLHTRIFFQFFHLNFIIEVTYITYHRSIFHFFHMLNTDDVFITGSGYKHIALGKRIFHGTYFKTFHGSLQRTNRIDLGHQYPCTISAHRLSGTFTHITVTTNHDYLTGKHEVGSTFNTICQ